MSKFDHIDLIVYPPPPRKATIFEYFVGFILGTTILALVIASAIGAVYLFS